MAPWSAWDTFCIGFFRYSSCYLKDISLKVVLNDGRESKVKSINAGVPRGSILGHLILFIIFIADIQGRSQPLIPGWARWEHFLNLSSSSYRFSHFSSFFSFSSSFCLPGGRGPGYATDDISHDLKNQSNFYAHDATIMSFVKSSENRPPAATFLNRDLSKIETWAKPWNILFGVAKCKATTISNLRDAEGNHPTLHFFGVTLEEADSLDLLGLTLNDNLSSSEPSGHRKCQIQLVSDWDSLRRVSPYFLHAKLREPSSTRRWYDQRWNMLTVPGLVQLLPHYCSSAWLHPN